VRFIDEASIRISGGHGGPGCVSFRREKFIPRGGPDGGDGGAGGSVIFEASVQLSTLQDFRFKRVYQAPRGMHGSGANKAGSDGEDIVIRIPVGTLVKDTATGELIKEFMADQERWVVCKGGRGGKGNAHFVTSTFQAPKFAQPGEEGEHREITLELKLLADVGILGFPNAGKSTLISRISAAKPKIADYPFTTLVPNLGVVSLPDFVSFVVADIPGLIEGAHTGAGLGHKFLKHIERTRVFIHLVDARLLLPSDEGGAEDSGQAVSALVKNYEIIRRELGLYNPELLKRPEVVVINKADLLVSQPEVLEQSKAALRAVCKQEASPLVISAATGEGIPQLLQTLQKLLLENPKSLPAPSTGEAG
jgi:GTPase